MSESEQAKRTRQLRNLVVMAMADGQISEREVNLVADRCAELGLSADDLQRAITYGLGDDAALELPPSTEERESLMIDLVRMMGADGRLDESEKRLFALAAAKMRISSDDLDRLISSSLR
jgi:uncharacterized tellurite resistance protein B-like protein